VSYGDIDPVVSRELFIRQGLVEDGYESRAGFHEHNSALIAEVEDLEAKSRRQDILVDPTSSATITHLGLRLNRAEPGKIQNLRLRVPR
jgi:HrpA-like RNA helicase